MRCGGRAIVDVLGPMDRLHAVVECACVCVGVGVGGGTGVCVDCVYCMRLQTVNTSWVQQGGVGVVVAGLHWVVVDSGGGGRALVADAGLHMSQCC